MEITNIIMRVFLILAFLVVVYTSIDSFLTGEISFGFGMLIFSIGILVMLLIVIKIGTIKVRNR